MYEPGLRSPLIMRGPGIQPGSTPEAFVANIDLAPTFLGLANLPAPESMQGRSLVPLLQGQTPSNWRKSVYYRYYHDPGHHNTRAHYGVRTATHKLIHYWRKDAYELFDLVSDPNEQNNLLHNPDATNAESNDRLFRELKQELSRLQEQYQDDGKYADPETWPSGGSDGPFDDKTPMGRKSVTEAIEASKGH
jgi:arylsulfatase A-like enzyme